MKAIDMRWVMLVAAAGALALTPACADNTPGDGGLDCERELCPEQACDDGLDDDNDGLIDCLDPGCNAKAGCELGFESSCDDGMDNDADGVSDCDDSNCNNVGDCGAWGEKLCADGLDNDGDGTTDCEDSDCSSCGGVCCTGGAVCVNELCVLECSDEQTRCGATGELCCAAGQLCLGDQCVVPTADCQSDTDCKPEEICEPVLGSCIPAGVVEVCQYVPPTGVLKPVVGCRWTPPEGSPTPTRDNVCMTPVVANLTDDNGDGKTNTDDVPDIAFTAWDHRTDHTCCDEEATLYVVSGRCNPDGTMNTIAALNVPDLDESGGLALGDLTGDGVAEIVAMKLISGSIAYQRVDPAGTTWEILWENDEYPVRDVHTRGGAQPALADLNKDGVPDVVVGNVALDGATGVLMWDGEITAAGDGGIGNNAFLGPVSIVADIDLDFEPEVIAGNTVYSADGTVEWTYEFTTDGGTCQGQLPCDGFAATGNFDDDNEGEVVLVRQGEIFVLEHDGQLKVRIPIPWDDCRKSSQKANESGPPTVADFDGDGRPEIGTAGADFYAVIDLDCVGDPLPEACEAEYVLWTVPNEDCSSRATASSVFDFEGDGRAEVVYADETSFRILDGLTGAELFRDDSHGSNTRVEMPVIADVDNDGNAEVIIPENENHGGTPGVEVWRDEDNNWVRSRRIWNQHSYHISNVSEDGVVPTYETPNWLVGQNNFRQNVQTEGVFYAPDLVVENVEVVCGDELIVVACVGNQGALRVPDGVLVTLNLTVGGESVDLEPAATDAAIEPRGACVEVTFTFVPPDGVWAGDPFTVTVEPDVDGTYNGAHNECDEDNNALTIDDICPA